MSAKHLSDYRQMTEDELDAALFGLAVECPYGDCLRTCPMTPLRQQSLRQRFQAITALDIGGKLRLMSDLVDCFIDLESQQATMKNT
jgi:hypothetical protein